MVVGRDAVLIRHERKGKSFGQKQLDRERKGQWDKVVREEIKRTNSKGGQDAIETE